MAGFDTKGGLTALINLVGSLGTVQGTVNRGVPEKFETSISAYVAVGPPTISRTAAGGLVTMTSVYFVGFGYAIEDAEELAEDALADTVDAFVRAVEADPSAGTAFMQLNWVAPGYTSPEYQTVVGQEWRQIRFTLEAQMRETVVRS